MNRITHNANDYRYLPACLSPLNARRSSLWKKIAFVALSALASIAAYALMFEGTTSTLIRAAMGGDVLLGVILLVTASAAFFLNNSCKVGRRGQRDSSLFNIHDLTGVPTPIPSTNVYQRQNRSDNSDTDDDIILDESLGDGQNLNDGGGVSFTTLSNKTPYAPGDMSAQNDSSSSLISGNASRSLLEEFDAAGSNAASNAGNGAASK